MEQNNFELADMLVSGKEVSLPLTFNDVSNRVGAHEDFEAALRQVTIGNLQPMNYLIFSSALELVEEFNVE